MMTTEEIKSIEQNVELESLEKNLRRLQDSVMRMKLDNENYNTIQNLQQRIDRTMKEIAELRGR